MKRYTPEELRTKTLSELRLIRADTLKKYQALASFKSSAEAAILPVVYMILKSNDPPLYVVRTARSVMDLPGFKSHDDDYGETLAYAQLQNPFMSNDQLSELTKKLKEALASRKTELPDSDECAYGIPFFKARQWLDVVGAWDEQENNESPARSREFLRKVAAKLKRAQKDDDDDYDTDSDDSEPDLSLPINDAAVAAEKAKKQEMKRIAEFFKERVLVLQDEDAPPLAKDDIVSMYRIWARGIAAYSGALIVEHMRSAFSAQPVYISSSDNALAFKGFALKTDDWVYVAPNNDPVNVFLREECVFSPTAKSFSRTMLEAYVNWYDDSEYPKTKREPVLKQELRDILEECRIVFPMVVRINNVSTTGWQGVALRNDPDAKAEPAEKKSALRKANIVERRMPGPNGALLESWPSIAKAATSLKIGVFKLKSMIAQKTADSDGAILMFADTGSGASTSSGASTPL